MKDKTLKVILATTLLFALVAATSATTVADDTFNGIDAVTVVQEAPASADMIQSSVEPKVVEKEEKKIKSTSVTYDVDDFDTLHNALTSDEFSDVTVNINNDISLSANTTVNSLITQLTINGNGRSVNGSDVNQFLEIGENSSVTINNLDVTNCYYDYSWLGGGAIYNKGLLTISNSSFRYNYAMYGGAIYNYINNLTITDTLFANNRAGDDGGAVYSLGSLAITNSVFEDNEAFESGGAVLTERGTISINQSRFTNNTAKHGGAINNCGSLLLADSVLDSNNAVGDWSTGGAVYNFDNMTITNSTISNSSAGSSGGAVYNVMGSLRMTMSNLSSNTAESGGAAYNWMGFLSIEDNVFEENSALEGGCMVLNGSTNNITGNVFTRNQAIIGGAILAYGEDNLLDANTFTYNNATNGGAVNNKGTLTVSNSTLTFNTADSGGAIHNSGNLAITESSLSNNTVEYNGAAVYNEYQDNLTITNSLLCN